jgi:hypothetical protein
VAVNLDNSSVDHRMLHVGIAGYGVKNSFENIEIHPVAETLEDRVPVPEILWQVAPRSACACDPQHRFQKQSPVAPGPAWIALPPQAMGLHQRPLRLREDHSRH